MSLSKQIIFLLLAVFFTSGIYAQSITQSIRGKVLDKQSQYPIPGVVIKLIHPDLQITGISDINGDYRMEGIPIEGRHSVEVSMMGYDTQTLSNLVLTSAKELEVNIYMVESITDLAEVVITAQTDKRNAINKMATVSARTLSIEEAGRYSGSIGDPARMAQNFAGVSGASDDRNDIIIRGNSPTGVLWRMEGIDIPSPNHFATLGSTGGPVSMLNINNLSNSDFLTSAWSADYGNALSGVFDLRLRNGNSKNREYIGQVGFNGFELGAEGPFKKEGRASYLVNVRYSTLEIFDKLGFDLGVGSAIPEYKDISYKLNFPTKKGKISLWGMIGNSFIDFPAEENDSTNLFSEANEHSIFTSKTTIVGGTYKHFFNKNTSQDIIIAFGMADLEGRTDTIDFDTREEFNTLGLDQNLSKISAHYRLNKKVNPRNTFAFGVMMENNMVNFRDSSYVGTEYVVFSDAKGDALLLQSYVNWQHRFNENSTLNMGLHSQHFLFSESNTIEPRLGYKHQVSKKSNLNIGFGLHSRLQPIPIYFLAGDDPAVELPNKYIDFTKSFHSVLGFDHFLKEDLRIKTELYYQYIFNVPVENVSSTFSMLNQGADFTLPGNTNYLNEGTGENYGFELTLEKFFSKGYYFLTTASLFESFYEGSDGIKRNTLFNGNYVFNALGGKEFKLKKNMVFSIDSKITYAGGRRYTEIDLEASQLAHTAIYHNDEAFEKQLPAYFRYDLKFSFKMNGKKISQEWFVDLLNLTNHKNVFQYGYNAKKGIVGTTYQRGFFPNIQYRIFF